MNYFDDLITLDPNAVLLKLTNFNLSNSHIVFDFDRTMTIAKNNLSDDITTWNILSQHLPPKAKDQYLKYYQKYRPIELDQKMTDYLAIEWMTLVLKLFIKYKINLKEVEKDLINKTNIRPGVLEIFEFCHENSIPIVIISAGILDIINIWCDKYDVNPSLIISTSLITDKYGTIIDWNKNSIIHSLNKSEAEHEELDSIRSKRPNVILIGDSIDDANMASGDDNVVRLRLIDDIGTQDKKAEYSKTFKKFDIVIDSGSLLPVVKLLESINR